MFEEKNLMARLRRRIAVWELSEQDAVLDGALTGRWEKLFLLWAEVKTIDNRQSFEFTRRNNAMYYQVMVRFITKLKIGHKITFQNNEMMVISVIPDMILQETVTLICEQRN